MGIQGYRGDKIAHIFVFARMSMKDIPTASDLFDAVGKHGARIVNGIEASIDNKRALPV